MLLSVKILARGGHNMYIIVVEKHLYYYYYRAAFLRWPPGRVGEGGL